MKSARLLREKIAGDRITMGILATYHLWLDLLDIARNAGLDYIVVDMEHGFVSEERAADACAMGRATDFPILIRPPATDYVPLRRAADMGACGFLLPQVEGTAQLDAVRDALQMPPRGRRSPGGRGNRWVSDVNYRTWRETVEDDFIVLPQIETHKGLANVEAIARHEITTAMAIGPYDLSASLGVCWQPEARELTEAVARIRAAGRAAGKNMWMIGDGPTLVRQGFTFLCLAEPSCLLEALLRNMVEATRSGGAAAVAKPRPE